MENNSSAVAKKFSMLRLFQNDRARRKKCCTGTTRYLVAYKVLKEPLLLLTVIVVSGCATPHTPQVSFNLGDTTVHAKVFQRGTTSLTMINVHDDENTSVLAGKVVVEKSGGRLIELAHSGRRFVEFNLDAQTYRFDPNRIFSDEGIRATLSRRGNYSEAAHRVVKEFTAQFIEQFGLDHEPVIVALHNTDGHGLTINSYRAEGDKSSASATLHASERRGVGDFFYVTDRRFFDYLKARDFNVTLQDDANVPDDGSASVYFARKGIPYLNIEADVNHLGEQTEMVRVARKMVVELGLISR